LFGGHGFGFFFFFFFFFRLFLQLDFVDFVCVIKVVICLFGKKVKENSNKFLSHLAVVLENHFRQTHLPNVGRGKERGESSFFFLLKCWVGKQ